MIGHIPVLYQECMDALLPEKGKLIVDGTLGGAGHTEGMLELGADVIGIDKDQDAIARCTKQLERFGGRFRAVNSDFKNIRNIMKDLELDGVDGALLDLGVSSFQIDTPERGFSYANDAPLDMRMDKTAPLSAYEVVNDYEEAELRKLIFDYGEEKFAGKIAAAIVKNRPVESTAELAEIIKNAVPAAARRKGGNPAKRTFQAIRIEVNQELTGLTDAIYSFIEALTPGGRLAVISFHSLEDRAVKQAFKKAENPCTCPPEFPVCVCGKKPLGRIVTRKPILPAETEMDENKRAHSAKLRVFERGTEA